MEDRLLLLLALIAVSCLNADTPAILLLHVIAHG
jgi:hypothetical protein